jgi:hypothetical protein
VVQLDTGWKFGIFKFEKKGTTYFSIIGASEKTFSAIQDQYVDDKSEAEQLVT